MKPQKTTNTQHNLEQENKARDIILPYFEMYFKNYSNQNNMVLEYKQTHRSMEQNREPRNKHRHIQSSNL